MNIIELNQSEISAISGGLTAAEIGSFLGGLAGSIGAAMFFASEGAKKKFDNFDRLNLRGKVMAVGAVAFGRANLRNALIIMGCVATGSIAFSILGYMISGD